jgi:acetate---CoA ligase (ADP-forming)
MNRSPGEGLGVLFAPESVAVIGASDDPARLGGRPIRYLLEAGYAGAIYPVNPKRDRVQGLKAYPSIDSLPQVPAVALVVVPAQAARDAVAACANRGVRGIYLLSGGFSESGAEGEQIQREIARIARSAGMRILGPNCLGAFNAETRFFGTFASALQGHLPRSGPVAIVSQSGAYGQHLSFLARRRGLDVKYMISTGNEIDVELAECIGWLAEQPEITVIAAYAEGLRSGLRMTHALESARRARKAVVFVKVGASEVGARAAASHTAALAGADPVHDGVFRQFGAWRATSTDEQVDVTYACVRAPAMGGREVGIVSVFGGFGVQAADAAQHAGLRVSPLPAHARSRLEPLLPSGGVGNPIDVTGQAVNDLGLLSETLSIVCDHGGYDALFVCLTTTPLASALEQPMREALTRSTGAFRRERPVVLLMVAEPGVVEAYEAEGFLVFEDVVRAVNAIGAVAALGRSFDRHAPAPAVLPAPQEIPTTPSEVDAKRLMRCAGVAVLPETLTTSEEQAAVAAREAGGPVALKITSPDIVHKTEIGGVMLDLTGDAAVRDGYRKMLARVAQAAPHARIEGILVAPMAGPGVETILGVARDPTFGPIVMFGLGGVFAECFRDTSFRVAPIDAEEALRMIDETRASVLLRGWRGTPAADVDALVAALVNLSRFAAANADRIESIDINPFLVRAAGEGAVALDATVLGIEP